MCPGILFNVTKSKSPGSGWANLSAFFSIYFVYLPVTADRQALNFPEHNTQVTLMASNFLNSILSRYIIVPVILLLITGTFSTTQAQMSDTDALVSDFINVYTTATGKVSQLAEAFPVEKYNWRPDEGIRSVQESILHVASGNYFFGSLIGAEIPEGINPQALEKAELNKTETLATFNKSVEHITNFIKAMPAEEFNTKIDFFGNEITKRQAMLTLGDHASEHLGQLIAYARMNGVVPPWSRSSN